MVLPTDDELHQIFRDALANPLDEVYLKHVEISAHNMDDSLGRQGEKWSLMLIKMLATTVHIHRKNKTQCGSGS